MLGGYWILGVLVLVFILLGLLLQAYYLGGSKTKKATGLADRLCDEGGEAPAARLGLQKEISEIKGTLNQLTDRAQGHEEDIARLKCMVAALDQEMTNIQSKDAGQKDNAVVAATDRAHKTRLVAIHDLPADGTPKIDPQSPPADARSKKNVPEWQANLDDILNGVQSENADTEKQI